MKAIFVSIFVVLSISTAYAQSAYYYDYKSFFGKEDRIGLYSKEANAQFNKDILAAIATNTLLVDCGTQGKPATGFILGFNETTKIVTAAHNAQLANKAQPCKVNPINKSALNISPFKRNENYQNTSTLEDAGFDIAYADASTDIGGGFEICQSVHKGSQLVIPQSYDGSGYIALSPICKITEITNTLITTTCRGHYKASGAPLLSVTNNKVCVLGVFNAHSGSLMNYESYAARVDNK